MNKIILPIVLVLIGCARNGAASPEMTISVQAPQPLPDRTGLHPLSIPALRQRSYGMEDFQLLNTVPAAEGLYAREFSYISDGNRNYGLIEGPEGDAPEYGRPVILLAHGHINPDIYSTTEHYRMVTRYYAAGGFLVIKPDYRGHGRSEGLGERSLSRTIDYSIDVLNLLADLNKIPGADTDNIFLYGHSMGGEISLRILTIDTTIKGATLWAAVTQDFPENTLYFIRRRNAEAAKNLQVQIESAFSKKHYPSLTPNSYLDSISVPMLIHHGTADESVPFEWSIPFRSNLDAAGVNYRFFEYPGEDHNISSSFYRVMDADMEFFRSLM